MTSRISRRALLADAVDRQRAALAAFAATAGAAPERAGHVADAATVRVFARGVPRDRQMLTAVLQLEVRRIVAEEAAVIPTAAARPGEPAPSRTALVRRVRAARVRRAGLVGTAVAAACALTVGAAVAVTRLDATPSSGTVQVAVEPPPTVVAEPSIPATPQPLGSVTEAEGLPPALPLLEGMLEGAGTGWSLVQVETRALDDLTPIYLVDPEGTAYEVPTPLADNPPHRDVTIDEWLPGTRLILTSSATRHESAVVDVLTGEQILTIPWGTEGHPYGWASASFVGDGTTDVLVTAGWGVDLENTGRAGRVVRLGLDGVERAAVDIQYGDDAWTPSRALPNGDGSLVAIDDAEGWRVVAATDLRDEVAVPRPPSADGRTCWVTRWLGTEAVLLTCASVDGWAPPETWVVPLTGEPFQFSRAVADAWPAGEDGLVVITDADSEVRDERTLLWGHRLVRCGWDGACDDEPFGELTAWSVSGVDDGTIYAFDAPFDWAAYDGRYVALDLATGELRTLLDAGPSTAIRAVVPSGVRGPEWGEGQW